MLTRVFDVLSGFLGCFLLSDSEGAGNVSVEVLEHQEDFRSGGWVAQRRQTGGAACAKQPW